MSDGRGPRGRRGPGYGYYPPGDGSSSTTTSASASASTARDGGSSLPTWALVLITVSAGLLTLGALLLLVLALRRRRRARREAARRDLEAQASERDTVRMLDAAEAKEMEEHAKPCESDHGEKLTFVVMAGEDQPSYLARAATNDPSTPLSPTKFEKGQQQKPVSYPPLDELAVSPTLPPHPETAQKSPPSPSREST